MRDRPNVLVVMCDQLRADVLGCYGHPIVRTPNIDRLAETGVTFTNAYSQTPVCVPARQNLLTGRHSHQLDLLGNANEPIGRFPMLAELLSRAGYATAAIGKMHFHPPRQPHGFAHMELSEEIPENRDQDDYLIYLRDNGLGHVLEPHGQRHETYYEPQISVLPAQHTTTAWTARRTAAYIRQAAGTDTPFFCMTGFLKPHPPFDPPWGFERLYDPRDIPTPVRCDADRDPKDVFLLTQTHGKWRELTADDKAKTIRSRYYGLVSHIDAEFGHILDALDQTGQRDNTLIVFTSDHGELLGDHYQYGKRSYFEAAARVPLIVAWPKTLPRNQQREHLAVLQDVFTTVLHAAGVETPDGVYGVNLLPAAADPAAASRDSVVGEFGHLEHAQTSTRSPVSRASTRTVTLKFMWRQDRWKYIYCVNGGRQQLFDIAASRDEIDDQADRRPELCRQFYDNLVAHYQALPGQPFLENSRLPVRPFRYNPALKEEFGVRNFQFPRWPQNERPT
ncbi:MAG: sulfatase-like hydrolase/transferase [Phycisphaerae bacterium]|nr:sulfatase-like hydrolase/transferase [Phycisphaerae bacterium]